MSGQEDRGDLSNLGKKSSVLKTTVDKQIAENEIHVALNTGMQLKHDAEPNSCTSDKFARGLGTGIQADKITARPLWMAQGTFECKDHADSDMHSRAMMLYKKQVCTCIHHILCSQ